MDEKKQEQTVQRNVELEELTEQYLQAAQEGDGVAQYNLARVYYQNKEYAQSFHWWEKAAENGLNEAWVCMALQCAYGLGVEKDSNRALDYVRKAVKENPADANALCHLGMFYEQGIGTDVNMEQALTCYRQAAEMGNPMAYFNLGVCYFYGKGVTENIETALKWVRQAAEMDYGEAQYFLGLQYFVGEQVEQDLQLSLSYLHKSADGGSLDARQLLPMVENEINVERQLKSTKEIQNMLDGYEAYMNRLAEELGCGDEEYDEDDEYE